MRSAMVLICCFGLVCSFFMAHLSLEDFAPARELVTGFIFVAGLKSRSVTLIGNACSLIDFSNAHSIPKFHVLDIQTKKSALDMACSSPSGGSGTSSLLFLQPSLPYCLAYLTYHLALTTSFTL